MAWLTGYSYRKKITVQTDYLDAVQTDFPLYVPINTDAAIGALCMANGYDIRFTASDGTTLLSYERVSFAVAAGAATGIFWVKTALATSPATDIYCYYGAAGAADVSNPAATFSAYTRVWHLSEAYGTGAGNYKDALGVGNLTLTDADADSAQGTGIVGKCVDLNGDADYLTDADHADHDPGGAMTMEAWFKADALPGSGFPSLGYHTESGAYWNLYFTASVIGYQIITVSGTATAQAAAPTVGSWVYCVGTYYKTLANNRVNVYRNGVVGTPGNGYNENIISTNGGIIIGKRSTVFINGLIDEVRYSKDAKSASWIKFVYRNIVETDNELTWAGEEAGTCIPIFEHYYRMMRGN